MISRQDIDNSYKLISNSIIKTPLVFSSFLSDLFNANIYLKLENMQKTGSFKERGTLNFLLKRTKLSQVVAASAGNHAQALAFHAKKLNIKSTIFMPTTTPNIKIMSTKKYGAQIKLVGENYDEAYQAARNFSELNNIQYVHAYDERDIIIGQGTIGLEIQNDLKEIDIILIPVGGGGLISGIASFFDEIKSPKIFGIKAKDYKLKIKTLAEGIGVKSLGHLNDNICTQKHIDFLEVDDDQIEHAIILLMEKQKIIAEGAAAASVAALFKIPQEILAHKNVVLIISGGNIDISLLAKFTDRELSKTKRLCRFGIKIEDCPGSLAHLLSCVTQCFANVVEVIHERAFGNTKWNEVLVYLVTEIKDANHQKEMFSFLKEQGFNIE